MIILYAQCILVLIPFSLTQPCRNTKTCYYAQPLCEPKTLLCKTNIDILMKARLVKAAGMAFLLWRVNLQLPLNVMSLFEVRNLKGTALSIESSVHFTQQFCYLLILHLFFSIIGAWHPQRMKGHVRNCVLEIN